MRKISYRIISRLDAADVQKGRFGRPKIQLSSKVAKFAGLFGIDLAFIFCMILKFEILSFFFAGLIKNFEEIIIFLGGGHCHQALYALELAP